MFFRILEKKIIYAPSKHCIEVNIHLDIHKDIFACLFSVHNTISLSCLLASAVPTLVKYLLNSSAIPIFFFGDSLLRFYTF